MDPVGFVSKHLIWPLNEFRERKFTLKELRRLKQSEFASTDERHANGVKKLKRLLIHAAKNCPFYKNRFDACGFHPEEFRDFADLKQIPPLSKEDLVQSLDELVAQNIPASQLHKNASGGSTGRHTPFYRDNECLDRKMAAQLRFMQWTGWDIGQKVTQYWPALQDFSHSSSLKSRLKEILVFRRQKLPAGELNEQTMGRQMEQIAGYAPTLIRAFPNPLSIFAEFIEQKPIKIRPRGIITVGEPLLDGHRKLFERVFDCSVYDCYVSRECGHIASECDRHDGLHLNDDSLHVEFLDENDQDAKPGQPGRIVITDYENFGMPFVRYEIQDMGIRLDRACSCGRTLPLMSVGAGRISDFIFSPKDHARISGASLCHYLLADGPTVGQLQIIQDRADHLTIKIRKENNSDGQSIDTAAAHQVLDRIFDGKMRISWEFVDQIPHEKSGKYRFCINQVEQQP